MVDRAVLATSVNMRFDTGGNPLEVCLPWPARLGSRYDWVLICWVASCTQLSENARVVGTASAHSAQRSTA